MIIEFKPIPDADLDAYVDLLNDQSLAANVSSVPYPITELWARNRLLNRRAEEATAKTFARGLYARVAKDHPASARVLTKNGFAAVEDDKYFSEIRDAEVEEVLYKLGK